METIRSNMQHIVDLLTPQMAAPPVIPPSPPGPVPRLATEPRLPAPERYEGNPRSCRSFLSTCSLVFKVQPSSFPTERSRVAYVITLLSGRAREWATAVWDANAPECQTFSQFFQAMRGVFRPICFWTSNHPSTLPYSPRSAVDLRITPLSFAG